MTASGRKKMDELYHPATERSEFYTMSDLTKPPVLFTPAEDIDKVSWVRLFSYHIYLVLLLESVYRILISAFISYRY